jgi:branched-chain amino acid transport system substrate-binding protein
MRSIVFLAILAIGATAQAQDKIKLGWIGAVSGPLNLVGAEQRRGLDVALEHLGNKLGGVPIELITGDSKGNPGATVQELSRLIEKERVDVLVGLTASNELLSAIKPISDAKIFFVGANGGPAHLAGEGCSPYYFNASFQNEQITEGTGEYINRAGVKKLYLMSMDYEAGREHSNAALKGYKGEVVAHVYTPVPQLDFASDIAKVRASGADGVWAFYPGGSSIAFVRQWAQAGLAGKVPLFSNTGLSEPLVFQAQGKAALGITITGNYFAAIDNPENRRFVEAFRVKYGRDPSSFSGLQYDAVMLLDAAVREVKGNLKDQEALRAALKRASFKSIRGPFRFNNNQFPIQNAYVGVVDQRQDGSMYIRLTGTLKDNASDNFHDKCPMK